MSDRQESAIWALLALSIFYIAAQVIRYAFDVSFGGACLYLLIGLGGSLLLGVLVGAAIREGARKP